jgi:anti-anti-sigma factor
MSESNEISLDGETGRLVGEIDVAVADRTQADLLAVALSAPSDSFVVDCAELTFIDMSGVHVLERVAAESRRQVHLVNLCRSCRIVFETLELCELFGIEPVPYAQRPNANA